MSSRKNKSLKRKAYYQAYDEIKKAANKVIRLTRHMKNQPNDKQSKQVLKNLIE